MLDEGRTIGGKFARCRVMHDPALRDDEAAVDAVGKGADVTVDDQGGHPAGPDAPRAGENVQAAAMPVDIAFPSNRRREMMCLDFMCCPFTRCVKRAEPVGASIPPRRRLRPAPGAA